MKTVNTTDILFATVISRGRTVAKITLSGMSSIADIMAELAGRLSGAKGLLTLQLRNYTQGWSSRSVLRMAAATIIPPSRPVQLSLF